MRIDRILLAVLIAAAVARPLPCQDPLTGVGAGTQVASIDFRFVGEHEMEATDLAPHIALSDRGGLVWLRELFGWLPLVSPVGRHPFEPLMLQRDVVRLRQFYRRSGFPDAVIDYDVSYDADPDLVEITFVVREGPPLLLARIEFVGPDSNPPALPAELQGGWRAFVQREQDRGGRLSEDRRRTLADSTARWFRHRGYPFAAAGTSATVDSAARRSSLLVRVDPGPRARIREITVSGNETVPERDLVRQLPVKTGQWYDAARLEQGRQALMQLDLVRLAIVRVPRGSFRDSSVVVQLQVTENLPRVVSGEMGFASGGGIAGQADWSHRSFLGGLRTFTVGASAQTGLLTLESGPQEEYRLAVSVFEPYIGSRRLSLAVGPFGEYRDDLRDRSWRVGLESALILADGPLRSIALGYTVSHRRILDYGFGGELEPIEYLPLLGLARPGVVGTLGTSRNRSAVTLDASWGRLDQFANPRKGYVIRPRIEITTPFLTSSEYLLLELGATAFLPLNDRIGFTLRAGAGRVYPFGKSVRDAENESPFVSLLRLREATFTAGGTRDVRGWGALLLGPKLPEVEARSAEDGDTLLAERYTPLGGLARMLASAEVQLPVPGMGEKWQSFLFLDGARVWTPDSRFRLDAGELEQDRFFFGTGLGIGYETVVGAVQVAVGYKLNPSALDLRDPDAVLDALAAGRPLSEVPTDGRRRWQLHLSVGATF